MPGRLPAWLLAAHTSDTAGAVQPREWKGAGKREGGKALKHQDGFLRPMPWAQQVQGRYQMGCDSWQGRCARSGATIHVCESKVGVGFPLGHMSSTGVHLHLAAVSLPYLVSTCLLCCHALSCSRCAHDRPNICTLILAIRAGPQPLKITCKSNIYSSLTTAWSMEPH